LLPYLHSHALWVLHLLEDARLFQGEQLLSFSREVMVVPGVLAAMLMVVALVVWVEQVAQVRSGSRATPIQRAAR